MTTKVTKVSLDETKIKPLIAEALATNIVPSTPIPTQVAHPWRATLRTALATTVGVVIVLGSATPEVLDILRAELGAYIPADMMAWIIAGAGLIVAVSSALTRIMAIPAVNAALARFGLAATPAPVSGSTSADPIDDAPDETSTDEDLPQGTSSEESDEEASTDEDLPQGTSSEESDEEASTDEDLPQGTSSEESDEEASDEADEGSDEP